jgi:hypothetical protein
VTNPESGHLSLFTCVDSVRVLVVKPLQGDTFVIHEDGEVSLADSATLKTLLSQLSGRTDL